MSLWQKRFSIGLLVLPLLFMVQSFATAHDKPSFGVAESAYSAVMVDADSYQITHPSGSMAADFWAAAASATYRQAAVAWKGFLKVHEPGSGEFEDGMHVRYVKIAKIELARIYYLQNKLHKADVLIKSVMGDF